MKQLTIISLVLLVSFSAVSQQKVPTVNGWELTGINSSSPDLDKTKSIVDPDGQVFSSYGVTRSRSKNSTIQMTWSKMFTPNLLLPDSVSLNSRFISGVGDMIAVCVYIMVKDSSGSWYFIGDDNRIPLDNSAGKTFLWDMAKVGEFGIEGVARFSIAIQVVRGDSCARYVGADIKLRSLTFFYGADARVIDFGSVTGIPGIEQVPQRFVLEQNYPNPFNPSTMISYRLAKASRVSLKVFNTLGQEVTTLVDEQKGAGYYQVRWDAALPSGVYFYRLQAGDYLETKKLILLR